MFVKYIMYLKNLLFFQFVLYFLCVSLMIWGIQNFKGEYQESIINQQNAQQALTEETLKLYSIINAKDEILAFYKRYSELNLPTETNCITYKDIIPKIQNLADKYKLIEPIDISINAVFFKNNVQGFEQNNEQIRINNYKVTIKYATLDLVTSLNIFRDIYSYMPPHTVVTSVQIRNEDVLTPKTIYKLLPHQQPDLIYVKLIMYIRELASYSNT